MSDIIQRLEKLSKKQLVAMLYEYSKDMGVTRSAAASEEQGKDIAIIGMSCRFPGFANSPEAFWELVDSGSIAINDYPYQRWDVDRYIGGEGDVNKSYTMSAGLIDNVDYFDADFFGISPREAETMDPQQRVVLEEVWTALENAGIASSECKGKNYGIFLGVAANEYMQFCRQYAKKEDTGYIASGNVLNMVPGRVAYLLGTHGPAMAIDTACSSSLVAVHTAIKSLRNDECAVAVAGGVNILLDPANFTALANAKMLSPSGRCHTFDAAADGYVRAEGCGILILKKLTRALENRDNVLAVIRGSSMSHNGRSASITAPSQKAQQVAIEAALRDAGLKPEDIDLVEAHGTGTALGDPIELHAINGVYGKVGRKKALYVGSVKANIGHAEAAAGIAGLVKLVLCLRNKTIPVQPNFFTRNPNVTLAGEDICIPKETGRWDAGEKKRACAVSSFGFSGINAHVVLEEWVDKSHHYESGKKEIDNIIALSAKNEDSLKALAENYIDFLQGDGAKLDLSQICYTTNFRKNHYSCRISAVGCSHSEMAKSLQKAVGLIASDVENHKNSVKPYVKLTELSLSGLIQVLDLVNHFSSFKYFLQGHSANFSRLGFSDYRMLSQLLIERGMDVAADVKVAVQFLLQATLLRWLYTVVPGLGDKRVAAYGSAQLSAISVICDVDAARILDVLLKPDLDTESLISFRLQDRVSLAYFEKHPEGQNLTVGKRFFDSITDSQKQLDGAQAAGDQGCVDISSLADSKSILAWLGKLYVEGFEINWQELYDQGCKTVTCPTYPYHRKRHWLDGGPVFNSKKSAAYLDVGGLRILRTDAGAAGETYQFTISGKMPQLLDDHRLFGHIVVPASFYMSLICEIINSNQPVESFYLDNFEFKQALVLNDSEEREFIVDVSARDSADAAVFFKSRGTDEEFYIEHCCGKITFREDKKSSADIDLDLESIEKDFAMSSPGNEFYQGFSEKGYTLGPRFKYVSDGWQRGNVIVRKVLQPATAAEIGAWEINPGVLDSLLQVVGSWPELDFGKEKILIPFSLKSLRFHQSSRKNEFFWCKASILPGETIASASQSVLADLEIYNEKNQLCISIEGFALRAISSLSIERSLGVGPLVYREAWRPIPVEQPGSQREATLVDRDHWLVIHSKVDGNETGNGLSHYIAQSQCLTDGVAVEPGEDATAYSASARGGDHLPESIDKLLQEKEPGSTLSFTWVIPGRTLSSEDPWDSFYELCALFELCQYFVAKERSGYQVCFLALLDSSRSDYAVLNQMLVAALRCFRQEHETIGCKVILAEDQYRFGKSTAEALGVALSRPEAEFIYRNRQLLTRKVETVVSAAEWPSGAAGPISKTAVKNCIVTGASGAIGRQLALWLASVEKASALILLGKRKPDLAVTQLLKQINDLGVTATYHTVDLSCQKSINRFLKTLGTQKSEVDSLFHLAGYLDDALFENISKASVMRQTSVKCSSLIRLLDQLPAVRNLICFSSLASAIGAPGQGAYAAANGFLDALSDMFKRSDIRMLSVNWGPWLEAGMAARLSESHRERLAGKGVRGIGAERALAMLFELMEASPGKTIVADIDTNKLLASLPKADRPIFSHLNEGGVVTKDTGLLTDQLALANRDSALDLISEFLYTTVAGILRMDVDSVKEKDSGFFDMGMDSLMVLEFRKTLELQLKVKVSSSVIFNYPKVEKLAKYLSGTVDGKRADSAPHEAAVESNDTANLPKTRTIDSVARELESELESWS
ncbi:SDR family NAD(P)-dependent oxidoreductase [Exilibacterium tricleocarpae]|uniref:SDR family NAD(P)-dependent oxidoreductase n=1 Tax=Exilibacterium tricleocarpae TaxID=2591008 RepID=A0A545SLB6_9GAMM|nr:SDR family NAD(P)-dependent oxidoreductase [Exilibacterium tricleocarpae]TQV65752.1 SDR family NAD(P)-dependent oxidoreductase [Exilibacterium tricleocarpae]